jgi:hypothetical protein
MTITEMKKVGTMSNLKLSPIKNAFMRAAKDGPVFEDDPHDLHDFLTIGINTEAKDTIIKDNKFIEFLDNDSVITNPFYVPLSGGSSLSVPKKDFYTKYSYCYSLLLRKNITIDSKIMKQIYERELTIESLKNILKYFTLVKTDIKLLHNNRFKRVTNLITKNILETLFGSSNKFQENEFVVPLFNLPESYARNYLSLYTVSQKIDNLSSIMSAINLYNSNYTIPIDKNVNNFIQNLDSNPFWTLEKNCKFDLFKFFNERTFSYNGIRLDKIKSDTLIGAKNINQLINEIEKNENKKNKKKKIKVHKVDKLDNVDKGYNLPGNDVGGVSINETNKLDKINKSEYQILYKYLKSQSDRTFYVNSPNLNVTKTDVANIFDGITNEKYRYELFNTLLVSKEYCHLVVNNKRVLQRNSDILKKYKAFYSYAFSYAWITMYLEESILGTQSNKYHRHVFDLETAHALPTFPFTKANLRSSPYLSLLLPDDVIDPQTNMVGLHTPYDHAKYHGVTDPAEAKRRFNIFSTGDPNKELFNLKDIDTSILSVSGSVMTACLKKMSPLFEKCTTKDTDYVTRWKTYFKHYYGKSDIDLMCSCDSMSTLIMYATKFINHICEVFDMDRSELEIKPDKKTGFIINKYFFKECVDDVNSVMGTEYTSKDLIDMFEQVDNNKNSGQSHSGYSEEFEDLLQDYFYTDYTAQKSKRNIDWRKSRKKANIKFDKELEKIFTDFTNFDDVKIKMSSYDQPETKINNNKRDSEIYFFVNDFRDEEDQVEPEENYLVFKYSESLKFKMDSEKMERPVEMFQIRKADPFNTVGRFHLPCVRSYYQNGKFYMLPSFITAMHTTINIDYKYFAGSRDPANICNKNYSRDQGLILNSSEKKGIIMYSKMVDEYNGMYKIKDSSEIFGPKDITHNFFCPGVYKLGLDKTCYLNNDTRYSKTTADVLEAYLKESSYNPNSDDCMINMFKIRSITKTGNVAPYKKWVADAFYEHMK